MRLAAKIDMNQPEIVAALRAEGCFVQPLHTVGSGVPDLLVGRNGVAYLLEVKRDKKAKLTDDQHRWHGISQMRVSVVTSVEEALRAVGI